MTDACTRQTVRRTGEDANLFDHPTRYGTHPNKMRCVVLESPYRGKTESERLANIDYARRAVRDALERGESVMASHLLYPQDGILDDDDKIERATGINAGHAWLHRADCLVVYIDRGISEGMEAGIKVARFHGIKIEERSIG